MSGRKLIFSLALAFACAWPLSGCNGAKAPLGSSEIAPLPEIKPEQQPDERAVSRAARLSGLLDHKEHPGDPELAANFERHRGEFEELLAMAIADVSMTAVAPDWTEPSDLSLGDVSAERIRRYRELFYSTGLREGLRISSRDRDSVTFLVSTSGLGVSGSAKGYEWRKSAPGLDEGSTDRVVDSTDDALARLIEEARASGASVPNVRLYRPLSGSWYLFYSN